MSRIKSKAASIIRRYRLTYDHIYAFRFAVNVAMATIIVWVTLRVIGDSNPMWAIASMAAASDPQPEEANRVFKSRLLNVLVGCATGLAFLVPTTPAIAVSGGRRFETKIFYADNTEYSGHFLPFFGR